MNVLTTLLTAQNLYFLPRDYETTVDITITEDNTNVDTTFTSETTTMDNAYQYVSLALSLTDGRFYRYTISNSGDILYRGRIFCTDQTDYNNYEIINNETVSRDDRSDLILI